MTPTFTAAALRTRLIDPDLVLESEYRAVHDMVLDAVASWDPAPGEDVAMFVTEVLSQTAASVRAIAERLGITLDTATTNDLPPVVDLPLVIDTCDVFGNAQRLTVTVGDGALLRYALTSAHDTAFALSYLLNDVRDRQALPVFAEAGWQARVTAIVTGARGVTVTAVHTPPGVPS
jgi:hypothetical protein